MIDQLSRELAQAAIEYADARNVIEYRGLLDAADLAAVLKERALEWLSSQPIALRMLAERVLR